MNALINRRDALLQTATAGLAVGWARRTSAQSAGIAKVYVGFSPGGTSDSVARMTANALVSADTTVIVENKPGASGQLAPDAARKAMPDGNSLFVTPSSILSLTPQVYKKTAMFDPIKDFTPVACVCDHSFGVAVAAASPAKTFADLVRTLQSNPQSATCGHGGAGPGTTPHVLGVNLGREIGVSLTMVPYKGVPPSMVDLMGGQLACVVNPYPTMIELHRGGKIRILAISNRTRIASLPDVPTFTELKMPSMEMVEWYGLFVSSRVPAAAVKRWETQLLQALAKPEFMDAAKRLEIELRPLPGEELGRLLHNDIARWSRLIRETGIPVES